MARLPCLHEWKADDSIHGLEKSGERYLEGEALILWGLWI